MWRALSVLDGELVAFLDADTEDFSAHFATGLLGPLVCESGVSFVKGFYRRPLRQDGVGGDADGGGRVNHLMAQAGAARCSIPSLPVCASRSPVRWRRGASCWKGWRSRPDMASRSRC